MGLLEAVETKSPADALFKLLTQEVHNIPDASTDNVHSVELHEGDWAITGSVKLWTYTIEVFKEKVEIDKDNRVMTLVAVGGDIMEQYCTYRIVYHVFPDGDSSRVKLQIVYKKFNENHPEPDNYLRFLVNVLKDIDALLVGKRGR